MVFSRALDSELEKIESFYQLKESEIFREIEGLLKDEEEYVADADAADLEQLEDGKVKHTKMRSNSLFRTSLGFGGRPRRGSMISASISNIEEEDDSDDEEADETVALRGNAMKRSKTIDAGRPGADSMQSSRELPARIRKDSAGTDDFSSQALQALYNSGITLKKRTISHYVSLCELKSFIQLNKTGFSKALKKYDKTLDRKLKSKYIEKKVNQAHPFQTATVDRIDDSIRRTERVYADIVTKGDVAIARKELRLHLREHVVWERNTVWREMIGIERKAQAANLGTRRTLLGGTYAIGDAQKQGDELDIEATKEVSTPVGKYTCPRWLFSLTFFTLIGVITVFAVLLSVPFMDSPQQQNCLAMLVFVSLLWATEVGNRTLLGSHSHPYAGYTALCDIATHPIPCRCVENYGFGGWLEYQAKRQRRHQACFCSYVDSSHYAPPWWLYHSSRPIQISHRQTPRHPCPK